MCHSLLSTTKLYIIHYEIINCSCAFLSFFTLQTEGDFIFYFIFCFIFSLALPTVREGLLVASEEEFDLIVQGGVKSPMVLPRVKLFQVLLLDLLHVL